MKKILIAFSLVAFLGGVAVAQTSAPKEIIEHTQDEKAKKTKKSCSKEEKKACSSEAKKTSCSKGEKKACCASKKAATSEKK